MATKDITDKMVCEAYAESDRQRKAKPGFFDFELPHEILARTTDQCEKVIYRAMQRADMHGLTEY